MTMLIEILQAREYRVIGAREVGDVVEAPSSVGKQFVEQGYAKDVTKPQRADSSKKVRSGSKEV